MVQLHGMVEDMEDNDDDGKRAGTQMGYGMVGEYFLYSSTIQITNRTVLLPPRGGEPPPATIHVARIKTVT